MKHLTLISLGFRSVHRRQSDQGIRPAKLYMIELCMAALIFTTTACDVQPLATGLSSKSNAEADCSACHGSADNAAPPSTVDLRDDDSLMAVGAHQIHVRASASHKALACEECHITPKTVGDPGHLGEAPAELHFGAMAKTGDLQPSWDHNTGTCSNIYCHGASLKGGSDTSPNWLEKSTSENNCGSCHGNPPPPPHPQWSNCVLCHDETLNPDNSIDLSSGTHIDGIVQAKGECYDCHGQAPNAWPAPGLEGETNTDTLSVGAHAAHMLGGEIAGPMACASCHKVPEKLDDPGHLDSERPAELTFGGIAVHEGTQPSWNRGENTGTCSSVYCHGATLQGGSNTEPEWTKVGEGEAACGSCHSLPPPAPHPASTACASCHPGTALDDSHIVPGGGLHVNGVVDLPTRCNGCHGDEVSAAPPRALNGSTDTRQRGVGAHRVHLGQSMIRASLACSDCHKTPRQVNDEGHLDDDLRAEVQMGALASRDGLQATYDAEAEWPSCSAVYCHGDSLPGGDHGPFKWQQLTPGGLTCQSCHGNPPPAPHPHDSHCKNCHARSLLDDQHIDLDSHTHIDGQVTFF